MPYSVRIKFESYICNNQTSSNFYSKLQHVAFKTPSNKHVIVITNTESDLTYKVLLKDSVGLSKNKGAKIELPPNSIITAIWSVDE